MTSYLLIKRMLDVIFSTIMIVLLMPVIILIAIVIKINSPGPIIFKQDRLGLYGKPFTLYKFRTMVIGAEKMGTGLFNYPGDVRVTKIGRILRSSSLDEIPQLFNILKGEMSFVGPRPPVTYENGNYNDFTGEMKRRFTIKPGVTGYAQIKGRSELSWNEKVKYDNEYIEKFKKWGPLLDFKIVLITIVKVIKMEGNYDIKKD